MRPGSVIIDVTAGFGAGYIQTSAQLTSLAAPYRMAGGVKHIKIRTLPLGVHRSAAAQISRIYAPYIYRLIASLHGQSEDPAGQQGKIIAAGQILNPQVRRHYGRRGNPLPRRGDALDHDAGRRLPPCPVPAVHRDHPAARKQRHPSRQDLRIRRSYTSTLLPDRVAVHFRYEADGDATGDWQDFEADASWRKVDVASVLGALKKNNLTVISMLGDYAGTPYTTGSARFICIAAAL